MSDPVIIYTDGACRGNPGPGGWGAILSKGSRSKELHGGAADTTNNRMELTAAIEALKALKKPLKVRLHSDSAYLVNGMRKWVKAWKAKNWKRGSSGRKRVENCALWQELDRLASVHDVEWVWVKAHAGDPGNERADMLANQGIDELPDNAASGM